MAEIDLDEVGEDFVLEDELGLDQSLPPETLNSEETASSEAEVEEAVVEAEPTTPSSAAPDEPSREGEGEEEFDFSAPLTPREKALMARLEEYTEKSLEQPKPATAEEMQRGELPAPEQINFLDGLDLDEAFSSPESFNKLLNFVYSAGLSAASKLAAENVMRSLPETVSRFTAQHLETKAMIDNFYRDNPDLDGVKRTVAAVANEISANNPNYTLDQVFKEAAIKTRQVLKIKASGTATPTLKKGAEIKRRNPGFVNGGGARSNSRDSGLDGLAKEVHDLLVES